MKTIDVCDAFGHDCSRLVANERYYVLSRCQIISKKNYGCAIIFYIVCRVRLSSPASIYLAAVVAYKSRYNSIIAVSQSNHHHKHDCCCLHHRCWCSSFVVSSRLRMRADKEGATTHSAQHTEKISNLLLLPVSLLSSFHLDTRHHQPTRLASSHYLLLESFPLFLLSLYSILLKGNLVDFDYPNSQTANNYVVLHGE